MNHVDIGDHVATERGFGKIVNLESFDSDGQPFYITEPRGPDKHAPAGNNRWGVKMDDPAEFQAYKDGILYFVNDEVRKLTTAEIEEALS